MDAVPAPSMRNQLLANLPPAEAARLLPRLRLVPLRVGETVYAPGQRLAAAYFPTTAAVSLYYVMDTGASAETAGVGREGMVGVSLYMGGLSTPSWAVVQVAGSAYQLDAELLVSEFRRGGLLQQRLLRYTQALLAQMAQTVICNRHHSIDQQLCRWLLLTLDRVPQQELVVTQEQIAATLGVRRESVTAAAGDLQAAGLIRCRRGHVMVLERGGLLGRVCECYAVVRGEMDRLLGDPPSPAAAREHLPRDPGASAPARSGREQRP
jgi:CRP-like cAMP-binding protein